MGKHVVLFEVYAWQTQREGTNPPMFDHHVAYRGDIVELPAAEAERGLRFGALGDADNAAEELAEDRRAATEPIPVGPEGDAILSGYDAAELVAYVGQFAGERDRVWQLEQARSGKPRKTVAAAAGYDAETGALLAPASDPAVTPGAVPPAGQV